MMRFLLSLLLMFASILALAQHPWSTEWRTLKTPRARVVYPSYLSGEAARVATLINNISISDTMCVGVMPKRLPILISPTSITSNGYVTMYPRMSVFYSKPMDDLALGSGEWYQTLATHEYRHVVQYSLLNHGFTKFAYSIFGAYGFGAMTYSVPQWYYEGDAVFAETINSTQGRGRVANFEMPMAALLCGNSKLYRYDKMLHRSYRDMIPNHYVLGYYLATGTMRQNGGDVFSKIVRRQSWYCFWPFAFGCGYKHFTGRSLSNGYRSIYNDLKYFYTERNRANMAVRPHIISDTNSKVYTNYIWPVRVSSDSIICIKSSITKASRFVILDGKGREKSVLCHTDASAYDTDGRILVYATRVPDIRWSLRDYSDIAVIDISTHNIYTVTKRQKYFSPAISPDGKTIAAMEFTQERAGKVVLLSLNKTDAGYNTHIKSAYYCRPLEYMRSLRFADSQHLVYISNFNNKNAIKILDIETLEEKLLLDYTSENLSSLAVSDGVVYYVSDASGVDNIYTLSIDNGAIQQVTNARFGASMPSVKNGNMLYCDYDKNGYSVAESKIGQERATSAPIKLNYFEPLLGCGKTIDYIPSNDADTTLLSGSRKYHQLSYPIRPIGWIPDADGNYISATITSLNTLQTLSISATEAYYTDPGYWRTGVSISYSALYPVFTFAASLGDNGDNLIFLDRWGRVINQDYIWRENILSATVSVPFHLSRYFYGQSAQVSAGMRYYNISNKPTSGPIELGNCNMPVLSASASYSWNTHAAYRDFNYPLSVSLSASMLKSIDGPYDASFMEARMSLTVPGIFRQNYFTITGRCARQSQTLDQTKLYLFDSDIYNLEGYTSARVQDFCRVGAEYQFPMGYPDIGIPSILWVKRLRGSVFGNIAKGTLYRNSLNYASVGGKILADFCVLRLNYDITAGISIAKGLKENGLECLESGLILSLPF